MVQRTCEINLINLIKLGLKTVLYLMLLRIKQQDYNVMIDGKNVFDRRIENDINTHMKTFQNLQLVKEIIHSWLFARL